MFVCDTRPHNSYIVEAGLSQSADVRNKTRVTYKYQFATSTDHNLHTDYIEKVRARRPLLFPK